MATEAQIAANQANSQHSTGPKTEAGKANSCQNNHRHGFTGAFSLLSSEDPEAYQHLLAAFQHEHRPTTFTEQILVERLAQHHWLRARALEMQNATLDSPEEDAKATDRQLALYLRYQISNERAFSKCLSDLLKLRAEKRKEQIGFESHQLQQAEHSRKQSIENRKQDLHKCEIWLAEAKAEHQELLNARLETPETRMPNRVQRILARQQAA